MKGWGGGLALFEADVLRALPEGSPAQLAEVLRALDDRREMVSRQLPRFAREARRAVGEQQLRLAQAARVQQQLTRRRVARRVLRPDPDVQVAPWDPARLAAPARVDDSALERQQLPERRHRLRRRFLLQPRDEPELTGDDLEH